MIGRSSWRPIGIRRSMSCSRPWPRAKSRAAANRPAEAAAARHRTERSRLRLHPIRWSRSGRPSRPRAGTGRRRPTMTRCDARRIRLAAALVCAAAIVARAPTARAQAEDQAAARALFSEGRALMKASRYAEACPKLEAARKLFTSAGILLNLADCHEKIGRTASAWTEFGEAAAVAKRTNRDDDAEEATRRQAALEPSLAHLTIRVAHDLPGLSIKRDGAPLASAAWGAALPVDPGAHEIRAEAAWFEPWMGSATVSKPGQVVTVDVPELHPTLGATARAGGRVKPVLVTVVPGETTPADSVLPWALIGGGAAVAVAGGVLMAIE